MAARAKELGKKEDSGFAHHSVPWVEVVRDGWRGYPGGLDVMLGHFPGCGEERVWAPAAPSVSGTELELQWPGEVQGHCLGWGR